MIDFIRFNPFNLTSDELKVFKALTEGFDLIVYFAENNTENKSKNYSDRIITANLIKAENVQELIKKLKRSNCFNGVLSSNINVNKKAIMKKKVDVLLDSEFRKIDYACVKLASEKNVIIEISFSKFLRTRGFKRMKLFDETKTLISLLQKFKTPFIFTSGAENIFELRIKKQICNFFENLSESIYNAKYALEISEEVSNKVLRRLTDEKYVIDGVEIEKIL